MPERTNHPSRFAFSTKAVIPGNMTEFRFCVQFGFRVHQIVLCPWCYPFSVVLECDDGQRVDQLESKSYSVNCVLIKHDCDR